VTHARDDRFAPLALARGLAADAPDAAWLADLGARLSGEAPDAARTWSALLHGGLAPLACVALDTGGVGPRLPDRLRASLRSAVEVNGLRNAVLRRAALEASRACAAEGIPVLWVKGIWLAHHVWPQPALRPMHDVDLQVPVGRRAEALAVLRTLGYAHEGAPEETGAATWTDTLTRPTGLDGEPSHVTIDLHDGVRLSSTHAWPVERLWADATQVRAGGASYHRPSTEAGLLYLAIHLFKHGLDLRHAMTAVADARTLLRHAGDALSLPRLAAHLADTYQAVALHALLTLAQPETGPGRALLRETGRRLEASGLRRDADRLAASSEHLPFSTPADVSLYEVAQRHGVAGAVRAVAEGLRRRWNRRLAVAPAAPAGEGALPSGRRVFRPAHWRYARATWAAGRLAARAIAASPSDAAARPGDVRATPDD
jgi:hypothetical protein